LQYCQAASLAFFPAKFSSFSSSSTFPFREGAAPVELHVHPQYRLPRGIEAMLRKVPAGFDEFVSEKIQDQVAVVLRAWSEELLRSAQDTATLETVLSPKFLGFSPQASLWRSVRDDGVLHISQLKAAGERRIDRTVFLTEWRSAISSFSKITTAELQVTKIHAAASVATGSIGSQTLDTLVRFEIVGAGTDFHREQRVGNWEFVWELLASGELRLHKWNLLDEVRSRALVPVFTDIAEQAFGGNASFREQMLHGTDYWRTVLDGASGIDVYGHNGVSVADIDGDGLDDLYVCQPAGLPNRMYRNRGGGTFEDITEESGLGVLENTACALFADLNNTGRQDLIVVRTNGPLLFRNLGRGKFRVQADAFQFAAPPQGTFTGAAIADYDRDGWLDIYFCLYAYYQGSSQYRYPMPYFDAENGPPNFLLRNNRDGTFQDVTKKSGLDKNNTRFSFCCAWGDYNGDQWPDLYVVNDFGRKNLYRNNGDGTFTDIAREAGAEDIGAGMSVSWLDFDHDSKQDLYVADMWTAAGMRISDQETFQKNASAEVRALYRKHAMGNCLLQNSGAGTYRDVSLRSNTTMGRWAWSSDAWDMDHDGFPDLYIANGMISGATREDLNSFFWRQVVANSASEARPSHQYEKGWNAINELIRSDGTWSGFERNVFYLNNRDGTFSDISGIVGLDAIEDSRTFALGDFDNDGRLEVVLKNRNGPQLRFFKNVIADLAPAISFRLAGKKSNRDAIGATVTIETSAGKQTRMLQAGSGFLAQHSKEIFFGLGTATGPLQATIRWPNGLSQHLSNLLPGHRVWVEEGLPPSRIEAFAANSPWTKGSNEPASSTETLPSVAETWLLSPIRAPNFSIAASDGSLASLSSLRGKLVLLLFRSVASSSSDLDLFEKFRQLRNQAGLQLLVINADGPPAEESKKTSSDGSYFPATLPASDLTAVYNLLYRHTFDRRRDLTLPTGFLIDREGSIVKIYQGSVPAERIAEDCKIIPPFDAQRLSKALPFPGNSATYNFGRNYLTLGSVFLERGYVDPSETFLRLALRDDPDSAEASYGLGSVFLEQKKNKQARESFERAIQLRSDYPGTVPNAWNNLGILSAREGKSSEAVGYFQRALQLDPAHPIALLNLGNVYRQMKDWPAARETLQRALALTPEDPELHYSLGMVFAQLDDTEQAYKSLKDAIALRPDYPEALNNLGVLCLHTRRPVEAISAFEESIRVAPAYDQSYLNLARVYALQDQREKSRAVLLDLLRVHPEHAQAKQALQQLAQ
jgi:tetratricopeptide (TPR) repeat protein